MAAEQNMTQSMKQVGNEAAKAAIKMAREAETPVSSGRPKQAKLRMGGQTLKWPTFNWKVPDKYQELCIFEVEVKTFSDKQFQFTWKWKSSNNNEVVRL